MHWQCTGAAGALVHCQCTGGVGICFQPANIVPRLDLISYDIAPSAKIGKRAGQPGRAACCAATRRPILWATWRRQPGVAANLVSGHGAACCGSTRHPLHSQCSVTTFGGQPAGHHSHHPALPSTPRVPAAAPRLGRRAGRDNKPTSRLTVAARCPMAIRIPVSIITW